MAGGALMIGTFIWIPPTSGTGSTPQDLEFTGGQLVLSGDPTPVDPDDFPVTLYDSAGNPRIV